MSRFLVALLAFIGGCTYLTVALTSRETAENLMPIVAALVLLVFGLDALMRSHNRHRRAGR